MDLGLLVIGCVHRADFEIEGITFLLDGLTLVSGARRALLYELSIGVTVFSLPFVVGSLHPNFAKISLCRTFLLWLGPPERLSDILDLLVRGLSTSMILGIEIHLLSDEVELNDLLLRRRTSAPVL